jgi:uncharacterized protein
MRKWLRLGLLLGLSASAAGAVDWKALTAQGYVSDFANVIDASGKNQLEAYCAAVERSTGSQIALVVVPSLEGEPIADVASTIYRGWGVGLKGKQEGILLLLAVRDRRSRLELGPGLKAILPSGISASVGREMRPALREGQYNEALMAAAETMGRAIAQAKKATPIASLPRRMRPGALEWIPWPVVIGGVLLLLWLMRAGRQRRCFGAGSGGFAGYDSADGGSGGFGGGDSAGR